MVDTGLVSAVAVSVTILWNPGSLEDRPTPYWGTVVCLVSVHRPTPGRTRDSAPLWSLELPFCLVCVVSSTHYGLQG
jgi:hypothetical protein